MVECLLGASLALLKREGGALLVFKKLRAHHRLAYAYKRVTGAGLAPAKRITGAELACRWRYKSTEVALFW